MNDIGKKIRTLREERGMTQEELAKKVGYKSRVSINKIELQRDIPIKKLVPIANALGVSPEYLMGWEETKPYITTVPKYDSAIMLLINSTKEIIHDKEKMSRVFAYIEAINPKMDNSVREELRKYSSDDN